MYKVKIKSNIRAEILNRLRKTVDEDFINKVQKEVIDGEIKRLIAAGVSPVQSAEAKRFKGYKTPDKYPGKKKAKRPVSLFLTGVMLSFYKAVRISGQRISMGIPTSAPQDVKERAEANNVGTAAPDGSEAIAPRRFVPLRGETYTVSVMRKLKNLYAQRIKTLISK